MAPGSACGPPEDWAERVEGAVATILVRDQSGGPQTSRTPRVAPLLVESRAPFVPVEAPQRRVRAPGHRSGVERERLG